MGNENGFTFTPKDGGIGMPDQKNNYDGNTADKMRRGANARVFDNNGGDSKAGDAGVVNKNAGYGPITYGF